MLGKKMLTQKYWFSLDEGVRLRALKKVVGHVTPDGLLKEYAKSTSVKELDFIWDLVKKHVKMPKNAKTAKDMYAQYKLWVDGWWMN